MYFKGGKEEGINHKGIYLYIISSAVIDTNMRFFGSPTRFCYIYEKRPGCQKQNSRFSISAFRYGVTQLMFTLLNNVFILIWPLFPVA